MVDAKYTAMLAIVDRSGSMTKIKDDMVGGFEAMMADQAKEEGILTVDIVTFDTVIEHQASFVRAEDVKLELVPRGSTALHDAMGQGISLFSDKLSKLPEHAKPANVQVVVITDGMENASREFKASDVKALVTKHTEAPFNWDFVFLGADENAVFAARDLGIDVEKSMYFNADGASSRSMTEIVGEKLKRTRAGDRNGFYEEERRLFELRRREAEEMKRSNSSGDGGKNRNSEPNSDGDDSDQNRRAS